MLCTWFLTVASSMWSVCAISLFERPSPISPTISRSRRVRSGGSPDGVPARQGGNAPKQCSRDGRRAQHLVVRRSLDDVENLGERRVARDEARDSGLDPPHDLVVDLADGERDDRRRRPVATQFANGVLALGNLEIDEGDVRGSGQRVELAARAAERCGAADDAKARVAAKGADDPIPVQPDGHQNEDSDVGPQQPSPGIHPIPPLPASRLGAS